MQLFLFCVGAFKAAKQRLLQSEECRRACSNDKSKRRGDRKWDRKRETVRETERKKWDKSGGKGMVYFW